MILFGQIVILEAEISTAAISADDSTDNKNCESVPKNIDQKRVWRGKK
jgi:hypothetical protein